MDTSKIRMVLGIIMTAVLLMLMSYTLIGAKTHEWLGLTMGILCVAHHSINWRWHKNLAKGTYSALRILQVAINGLMALALISLIGSGIVMSLYIFKFLGIQSGNAEARMIHMLSSYWIFIIMAIHIGFHGNMISRMFRKRVSPLGKTAEIWVSRLSLVALSIYGVYSFYMRDIAGYLLLQNEFVFLEFNESIAGFLFDYFSIMVFVAFIGYRISVIAGRHIVSL